MVESLASYPTAADAIAAHVPDEQRDSYCQALSGLLSSEVIRAR